MNSFDYMCTYLYNSNNKEFKEDSSWLTGMVLNNFKVNGSIKNVIETDEDLVEED
jgi:hypothetical protein